MAQLYKLAQNYQNLWELVEDESIDLNIVETALQDIEGQIKEKAENLAYFIKSLGSDVEIIKAEENRLAARRKALENKQTWLKNYLHTQLEIAGVDKVKTTDEAIVPTQFKTVIPASYTIDKNAIKDAIKRGEEVPGCSLSQGRSLRIR